MSSNPACEEACESLGLHRLGSVAGSTHFLGTVDGTPVDVRSFWSRQSDLDMAITACRPIGSDLHLHVQQAGLIPWRSGGATTGDAAFDGVLEVFCADAAAADARALLGDDVRSHLRALVTIGRPDVTDEVVRFQLSSLYLSSADLVAHVRRCVAVAHAADAHVAALPPPRGVPIDVVTAFIDAAREHGLTWRAHPLGAVGGVASAEIAVRWRTLPVVRVSGAALTPSEGDVGYTITARFHEPLGVGLSLRPADLGDRLKGLVGLGDLALGDAAFDRQWFVVAADAAMARAQLHAGARAHLQRLVDAGLRFTLGDAGLDGRGDLPSSPEAVPTVMRLVAELRDILRPRAETGPYR